MPATATQMVEPQGPPPMAIPGFEYISRYWDPTNHTYAAKILPGEYYVTLGDEMIVTILGSCVSACVWNPFTGVGGMNHFLLPAGGESSAGFDSAASYGCFAMELLINGVMGLGGTRAQLQTKIFGGGQMLATMSDLGEGNIAFVRDFLATEGIQDLGGDVGGSYSRKIRFFPKTGRVQVRRITSTSNQTMQTRESDYLTKLRQSPVQGTTELF